MISEHIGQADRGSLIVEKFVAARLSTHWQCPALLRNAFDLAAKFDFFD